MTPANTNDDLPSMTLDELIANRVDPQPSWIPAARRRLEFQLDGESARDVALGWMHLPTITSRRNILWAVDSHQLVFIPEHGDFSVNAVQLREIIGLDLLEGTGLPLLPVEVRLEGGKSMLVGWTQQFCESVVSALSGSADSDVDNAAPVGADQGGSIAAAAEAVGSEPTSTTAQSPDAPHVNAAPLAGAAASSGVATGEFLTPPPLPRRNRKQATPAAQPGATAAIGPPPPAWSTAPPRTPPATSFDEAWGSVEDAAVTEFLGHGEAVQHATDWPEPFLEVNFLTGPNSKRRKNIELHVTSDGVLATAGKFGSWKLEFPPDTIASLAVYGVDEILFTHNQRIGASAAALVVATRDGDHYVFEVPDRHPLQVRAQLAHASSVWFPSEPGQVTLF